MLLSYNMLYKDSLTTMSPTHYIHLSVYYKAVFVWIFLVSIKDIFLKIRGKDCILFDNEHLLFSSLSVPLLGCSFYL